MTKLLLAALLLAGSAVAAEWAVTFYLTTKDRDVISVDSNGKEIRLCREFGCSRLTKDEARKIAEALLVIVDEKPVKPTQEFNLPPCATHAIPNPCPDEAKK